MHPESDEALFTRYARSRDADAFSTLVRRHAQMVFATALRITRNRADAEDVTQTCFYELARSWAPNIRSVPGWLHTVAISRSHDALRWSNALRRRENIAQDLREPSSLEEWRELEPEIDQAIAALEETFRTPMVLHYLQGVPQTQIAEQLGVTQSTISRRLQQGVEMLRCRLREAGVVPSLGALALLLESSRAVVLPPKVTISLGKMSIAGLRPTKISWEGCGRFAVGACVTGIILTGIVLMARLQRATTPAEPVQQIVIFPQSR